MTLPNTFANETSPNMVELDQNFQAVGEKAFLPCTVSGTNALTLTQAANTVTVSTLSNYMQFSAIAAATNTSSVTIAIGGLSPLPAYLDTASGPTALVGGEIVASCAFTVTYDSALNSGNGGFHLRSGTAMLSGTSISVASLKIRSASIPANGSLIRQLHTLATLTFTNLAANSSQDQTLALASVVIGDNIMAQPFSIAPTTGLSYYAFAHAAGSVTVRAINATAASLTPTGGTFAVTALGYSAT